MQNTKIQRPNSRQRPSADQMGWVSYNTENSLQAVSEEILSNIKMPNTAAQSNADTIKIARLIGVLRKIDFNEKTISVLELDSWSTKIIEYDETKYRFKECENFLGSVVDVSVHNNAAVELTLVLQGCF